MSLNRNGSYRVEDVRNMRSFRVGKNCKNLREVRALSYIQAAHCVAKKLFGNGCSAKRIWGDDNTCGYFQAFMTVPAVRHEGIVLRESVQKPLGKPFWLQCLPKEAQAAKPVHNMFSGLNNSYVSNRRIENGYYDESGD